MHPQLLLVNWQKPAEPSERLRMPWVRNPPTRSDVRRVRLRRSKRSGYRRDSESRETWLNLPAIVSFGEPGRIVGWSPRLQCSGVSALRWIVRVAKHYEGTTRKSLWYNIEKVLVELEKTGEGLMQAECV